MNKYNLYRIRKDQEESLIAKLESSGMERTGEREIEGYRLSFYFSREPAPAPIWWADTYADLLPGGERPQNLMYYGVLLLSNSDSCYAVSLGKSHFYLRDFCDSDFGLDVAERIADPRDVRTKNSRYFQSRRSKTITTYQKGSEVEYGGAESFHYLRARTLDQEKWGEVASFGTSVQFTLPQDYTVLPRLIRDVEQELQVEPRFRLPRVENVTDEAEIAELDRRLADAILHASEAVSVDDLLLSGVEFVFSETSSYTLSVRGRRTRDNRLADLSIGALRAFIDENGIDLYQQLDDIRVREHDDCGRDRSSPLKAHLRYVDDPEDYCLIDGEWRKFSRCYVEYLHSEVDKLGIEEEPEPPGLDKIDEGGVIDYCTRAMGYVLLHRSFETVGRRHQIERGDLYRDGTIYHVKAAGTALPHVVNQALASLKLLESSHKLEIGGRQAEVHAVCLWLLLDRKTRLERLSQIRSFILQMRLVEWRRATLDAGLSPRIRVTYYSAPKTPATAALP